MATITGLRPAVDYKRVSTSKQAGARHSSLETQIRCHAPERGAPIHPVQATLGDASVATTGRYLHARPTDSSARYLAV
jgi:hypothetical protein